MTMTTAQSQTLASAKSPAVSAAWRKALSVVREVLARRSHTAALRGLGAHHLQDIGLTEGDIDHASRLPLNNDAALHLRRAGLGRSGNW